MKPIRRMSIVYKSILIAACLAGLVLNRFRMNGCAQFFSYYTIQSNLVCLLLFMYLVFQEIRQLSAGRSAEVWHGKPILDIIKGGSIPYVLTNLIVYHFILGPRISEISFSYQLYNVPDLLAHYIVPLMVLLDYFLFDPKGKFKFLYPLFWALMPLSYLLYVEIFTTLGGQYYAAGHFTKYPYFFFNIDQYGLAGVGQWLLLISAGYLLASYILIAIDHILGMRKTKNLV